MANTFSKSSDMTPNRHLFAAEFKYRKAIYKNTNCMQRFCNIIEILLKSFTT